MSYAKEMAEELATLRSSDHKIVLVTGCFDVLHVGHIVLLDKAAAYGMVVVGINSDNAVRKLKGPRRPVNNESDRAFILRHIQSVDRVFLIDDITVDGAIHDLKPDYWVKGGDYTMDTLNKLEVAAAKEAGTQIVLVPQVMGYSTTNTVAKC